MDACNPVLRISLSESSEARNAGIACDSPTTCDKCWSSTSPFMDTGEGPRWGSDQLLDSTATQYRPGANTPSFMWPIQLSFLSFHNLLYFLQINCCTVMWHISHQGILAWMWECFLNFLGIFYNSRRAEFETSAYNQSWDWSWLPNFHFSSSSPWTHPLFISGSNVPTKK